MKKRLIVGMMILCMLFCYGCGMQDQAKLDVYQYLNEDVKPISQRHNDAIAKYNVYMDNADSDAAALLASIDQEILPDLTKVRTDIAALQYQSSDVNAYVEEYKNAVDLEIAALHAIADAVEQKSADGLAKANEEITQAMQAMDTYQTHIRTLAAGYGITLVNQD